MIETIAFDSQLYVRSVAFRDAHLRRPLGLRLIPADVVGEDQQIHIAAHEDGVILGIVIVKLLSPDAIKLRQMAVVPEARGTGLGTELIRFAEAVARAHSAREIELNARIGARGFYERLGYAPVGEGFTEIGLPHIKMTKRLSDT